MLNGILVHLKNNLRANFPFFSILIVYTICSAYFFGFIWNNTANILYWDQWDIVHEVVDGKNWWNLLFFQHNEHKMGLGLIITKYLATLTSWDNRAETIFTGLLIFTSSALALLIKRKLLGKFEIYDIFIPVLFLNFYQWENLVWGFQISFVLPLLMFFIALFLYTLGNSWKRNTGLLIVSLLSIFTHFHGLIVVLITGAFFGLNIFKTKSKETRNKYIFLTLANFLIGLFYFYKFQLNTPPTGAESNLFISFAKKLIYIVFELNQLLGLQIERSLNLLTILQLMVLFIFPTLAGFLLFNLIKKSLKDDKVLFYFPIIALFLFTFIFCLLTAFGRSDLGLTQAFSSRYATFMIPIYFFSYLSAMVLLKNRWRENTPLILLLLFLILIPFNLDESKLDTRKLINNLESWKVCYLKTTNIKTCSEKLDFQIYPKAGWALLNERLDKLKLYKLNFFSLKYNVIIK